MSGSYVAQSRMNSCVAACVAMVRTHLGLPTTEQDVLAEWGEPLRPRGYATHKLETIDGISSTWLEIDNLNQQSDALLSLDMHLFEQRWVVAEVLNGPLKVFARKHGLNSKHGDLVPTYDDEASLMSKMQGYALGTHVLIVIGRTDDIYHVLDPYHGLSPQPIDLPESWLVKMSTNQFWVCPLASE